MNASSPHQIQEYINMELVANPDGLTSYELAYNCGEPPKAVAPVVTKMKNAGLLIDTGLTRKNASRKQIAVLTLADTA